MTKGGPVPKDTFTSDENDELDREVAEGMFRDLAYMGSIQRRQVEGIYERACAERAVREYGLDYDEVYAKAKERVIKGIADAEAAEVERVRQENALPDPAELIARLRTLNEAATPRPWVVWPGNPWHADGRTPGRLQFPVECHSWQDLWSEDRQQRRRTDEQKRDEAKANIALSSYMRNALPVIVELCEEALEARRSKGAP
jgi:hypothetical protein